MKILIGALLIGALGASSFLFADASSKPASTEPTCNATVTCTPEGTCVVRCERPDGQICTIELDCDASGCAGQACTPPAGGCAEACTPGAPQR
jgi:hypothetical protein